MVSELKQDVAQQLQGAVNLVSNRANSTVNAVWPWVITILGSQAIGVWYLNRRQSRDLKGTINGAGNP